MSGSVGGVDASIPLQAGRGSQQSNPLQQIGEFANAARGINELKLFPGQQQLQQQAIQRGGVSNAQQFNQAAYGAAAHLLALPEGGITHSTVTSTLASAEQMGIPTHGVIADIMKIMPTGDGPDFDRQMRSLILSRTQAPQAAAGAVTPTPGMLNLGGQIVPTLTAPPGSAGQGSVTQSGPGFAPSLSPSEKAAQVGRPVTGEEAARLGVPPGTIITETLADRLTQQGASGALTPQRTPPLGNGAFGPNGGRLAPPPALLNPNRSQAAAAPASGGPVVTGQSPAQLANQTTQGAQAAAGFNNITEQGNRARMQDAQLATMENDLNQFSSGTGAGKTLDFKRALVSWAPGLAVSLGVDPTKVAANESFNKLAAQIADAQGAGSDARLAVNQEANPSAHLSPEGASLIIKQLRGNADYLRAQQQLAVKYPDKTDYNGFSAQVTNNLDPRAFQFARLSPEQKRTYFNSLGDGKEQFKKAYLWSKEQGLLAQ